MVRLLSSMVTVTVALVALVSAHAALLGPAHLHAAAAHTVHTVRPRSDHHMRADTPCPSAATVPTGPASSTAAFAHRIDSLRRLFGITDVWSWLGDKTHDELLQQAKDKITAMQQRYIDQEKQHAARHLAPSPATPPEMGTAFHVLRFFANRVGEVNDDAYTEQERLAALGSKSSSGSSSIDADARKAAVVEASRAKAAEAYGLTTSPHHATTAPPLPPVAAPTPASTETSLLTSMEW